MGSRTPSAENPEEAGGHAVRTARLADELAVRRVLDGALLEYEALTERLRAGDVLVAEPSERVASEGAAGRNVRGALVLSKGVDEPTSKGSDDGGRVESEIAALAVHRRHRERGIGRALVEEARARRGTLFAEFDRRSRGFYTSLGFEIEGIANERFRGRLETIED